jgi:hypothetical protein
MAITSIQLSPAFSHEHLRVLIAYLTVPNTLSTSERETLLQAIDVLRDSRVTESDNTRTFGQFYETFIDARYADEFLEAVWLAGDVDVVGRQRRAEIARAIRQQFQQQGWYQAGDVNSRVLLTFCLYWWTSFAVGYTFEVEILRDLAQSGISLRAHDPRQRAERYAPADFTIGAWTGGVKSSAYFFLTARSASLPHDFYVSRYYDTTARQRHRMVILKHRVWEQINGATRSTSFPHWPDLLLHPLRFTFAGQDLIAVDYEVWKERVRLYQQRGGAEGGSETAG